MKRSHLLLSLLIISTSQAKAAMPDYLTTQWEATKISKSPKEIQKYLQQSKQGNSRASAVLGYAYCLGINVKRNYPLAKTFFNKAISKKSLAAMHGSILIDLAENKITNQTIDLANQYAKMSSDGLALRGKILLKKKQESGLLDLTNASKAGSGYADYQIADLYRKGNANDIKKSIQFMQSAAGKNVPNAITEIGIDKLYGYNLAKNVNEGMQYLQKAAERGSPEAYYEFGKAVYENPKLFKNKINTAKTYLKYCSASSLKCQMTLGAMLIKSNNPKEQMSGMKWLHKASMQGSAQAARVYTLANLLRKHPNTMPKSLAIARYAESKKTITPAIAQKLIRQASKANYQKSTNILNKIKKGQI